MAYTAAHGPPDIDATHTWAPVTGDAPPVINDRGADPPLLPWIKLLRIEGWSDAAELEDRRASRTYGRGEVAYPPDEIGRTVIYVCEIRATTREEVRSLVTASRRGFADDRDGTMTVAPYPVPGGVTWTLAARCLQFDADDTFSYYRKRRAPYRWGMAISLRMADPLYYSDGTGYV